MVSTRGEGRIKGGGGVMGTFLFFFWKSEGKEVKRERKKYEKRS